MTSRTQVTFRSAPVVIVGSGAAGLACALALAPLPVIVITKTVELAGGSSPLSQGGIAAALGSNDAPEHHAKDTLRAGAGLADPESVGALVRDGPAALQDLIAAGFPADRHADGSLALGLEGAHSRPRILHAGGDATGRCLVDTLLQRIAATPSIEILPATLAVELIVENERVAGLRAFGESQGWIELTARAVVLATGGVGALWQETTNPAEATGDGLALAARAGAQLADLEFMQFHPTAVVPRTGQSGGRLALLTEALRGAGARLIDTHGTPFMMDEHSLGDLAPRDAVSRAIWRRRAAGEPVFLDLRPALAGHGRSAFPQALALCFDAGYDPGSAPVPVAPAAHYHMGGVLTDDFGRCSVPGLWACGEVASSGVHGANRLASNSLLEALVVAHRLAGTLRREIDLTAPNERAPDSQPVGLRVPDMDICATLKASMRTLMSRRMGIIRNGSGLSEAMTTLDCLQAKLASEETAAEPGGRWSFQNLLAWSELRNLLLAARFLTFAALRRAESRGAHFRSDHPQPRREWQRRQVLSIADIECMAAGVAARTCSG